MSPLHNQGRSLYELLRLVPRGHPSASYGKNSITIKTTDVTAIVSGSGGAEMGISKRD
jgi:hypothetical protein